MDGSKELMKKQELKIRILLFVLAIILFFIGGLTSVGGCDYPFHRSLAYNLKYDLLKNPKLFLKDYYYPVWYFLVKIVTKILKQDSTLYGCQIVSGILVATSFLITHKLYFDNKKYSGALAAFALCIVGPLYFPWYDIKYYEGQCSPNVWHNPTSLLIKPIAILIVWILVDIFNEEHWEKNKCIWLSILLVVANLSKPSFSQILYPTVFLVCLYLIIKTKGKYWGKAIKLFCYFLPSVICMILQFIIAFYVNDKGGGITISWFTAWGYYAKNIPISVFLVICFPFLEMIRKIIYKEVAFDDVFVWILFVVSFLEYAFIAEKGERALDGNFGWGYQLALFFVWIQGMRTYLEGYFKQDNLQQETSKLRGLLFDIETITLIFHAFFGIRYIYTFIFKGACL